jgi:hypothetical protein
MKTILPHPYFPNLKISSMKIPMNAKQRYSKILMKMMSVNYHATVHPDHTGKLPMPIPSALQQMILQITS